jgi:hypothetical protein
MAGGKASTMKVKLAGKWFTTYLCMVVIYTSVRWSIIRLIQVLEENVWRGMPVTVMCDTIRKWFESYVTLAAISLFLFPGICLGCTIREYQGKGVRSLDVVFATTSVMFVLFVLSLTMILFSV